jgi:hypothetical protein
MSLPVAQQRALNKIDGDLRASEPDLALMFGIFTRLSGDDGPAVTEQLPPSRLRAVASGLRGFVLIPVAIAMVVITVVLGGGGRSVVHQRPPARTFQLAVSGK